MATIQIVVVGEVRGLLRRSVAAALLLYHRGVSIVACMHHHHLEWKTHFHARRPRVGAAAARRSARPGGSIDGSLNR